MNGAGFFKGVAVAVVLALLGAIGYAGLATFLSGGLALRLVVVALSGAYLIYLLRAAQDRTGRIATFTGWLVITLGMALYSDGLAIALITQTVLISVVRTFYYHRSALAGLLDLGLSGFALSAALWAGSETGSLFLTAWSYFLVQALFPVIPTWSARYAAGKATEVSEDEFGRAYRTAENAIRRIATERS
jgi:hypothetical protein